MKSIILNLIFFQFIIICPVYSQQVGSWELFSKFQSPDSYSLFSRGYNANKIAISNQNSIVALSKDTLGLRGRSSQPTIVLSTDDGLNWTTIRKDTTDNKHNFVCISHPTINVIVVTGDTIYNRPPSPLIRAGAFILTSRDAGSSWNKIYLDSNTTISSISMSDSLNGALIKWTLGNQYNRNNDKIPDSIYITNDGWLTWKSIEVPDNQRMRTSQIEFINPDNIIFWGYSSYYKGKCIWRTTDGCKTWVNGGSHELLINQSYKLKLINNNTAWLVGCNSRSNFVADRTKSVILKSEDGGMTWNEIIVNASDTLDIILDISFSDDNNGVLVGGDDILGDYSKIYRTKDGGKNWIREFTDFYLPVANHRINNVILKDTFQFIFETRYDSTLIYQYNNNQILSSPIIKDIGMQYPDNAKIEWSKIEGATKYRVQLDDKVPYDSLIFQTPVIDTIVVDTNIIIKTLEYDKMYFVRAQSLNDTKESEWYVTGIPFYTTDYKGQMIAPKIISPRQFEMNVALTPTFIWEKVDSAISYELVLYWQKIKGDVEIFRDTTDIDTSISLPFSLKPDSIYYVYVSYKVGDSISLSSGCYFHTTTITVISEPDIDRNTTDIKLYPNPCKDNLFIHLVTENTSEFEVEFYDILGYYLKNSKIENANISRIDVSDLPTGVYFIKVRIGKINKILKVIKVD